MCEALCKCLQIRFVQKSKLFKKKKKKRKEIAWDNMTLQIWTFSREKKWKCISCKSNVLSRNLIACFPKEMWGDWLGSSPRSFKMHRLIVSNACTLWNYPRKINWVQAYSNSIYVSCSVCWNVQIPFMFLKVSYLDFSICSHRRLANLWSSISWSVLTM